MRTPRFRKKFCQEVYKLLTKNKISIMSVISIKTGIQFVVKTFEKYLGNASVNFFLFLNTL